MGTVTRRRIVIVGKAALPGTSGQFQITMRHWNGPDSVWVVPTDVAALYNVNDVAFEYLTNIAADATAIEAAGITITKVHKSLD